MEQKQMEDWVKNWQDTDEKKKLRNTNKRRRDIKKEKNVGRLRDE